MFKRCLFAAEQLSFPASTLQQLQRFATTEQFGISTAPEQFINHATIEQFLRLPPFQQQFLFSTTE